MTKKGMRVIIRAVEGHGGSGRSLKDCRRERSNLGIHFLDYQLLAFALIQSCDMTQP